MSPSELIEVQASDTLATAAAKVTLGSDVIILLFGSVDAAVASQVRSVCARALAPVAVIANALIVDNGSSEGLAALMGQAARQVDQAPGMLGILQPNIPGPEPNHTILRLPGEWADPAKSSFLLTAELAKTTGTGEKPVVALLFGGGDEEKATVLRCARRGWPILVVQGAGGLGDTLAIPTQPTPGAPPPVITDPDLREILDMGTIGSLSLDGNADDLRRVLLEPIQKPGEVLAHVWSRYDDLDTAAVEKQKLFRGTQLAILSLAVAATFLAIVKSDGVLHGRLSAWFLVSAPWLHYLHLSYSLHILLILVPITTSVLVGINSRFREGNKWILLRAASESIKREIFRYRTRSGAYRDEQCRQISAPSKLAAKIKDISSSLIQSEVNRTNLPHQAVKGPLLVKFLAPEEYLVDRIQDQATYFVGKTATLYKQLKRLQLYILVAGGLGTFLAAIGLDVWVALTTSLATAFTTKLEIDQVENSLVQYNVALANLRNIESWWKALSPWEKTRPRNIDLLVDQTEQTLERETAGWVQQMQSTLDKLTEKHPDSSDASITQPKT
jgi:SMODS and SLOG-associating 2TM effector domain 1/SLOG in TRPM, prokaryote/Protein of unknown function (DUF4231)